MLRLAFLPKLQQSVCISGTKTLIASTAKRCFSINPKLNLPGEGEDIKGIPSREAQVERLRAGDVFDVLVIGGGATGCGVALDGATCIDAGRKAELLTVESNVRRRASCEPPPPAAILLGGRHRSDRSIGQA